MGFHSYVGFKKIIHFFFFFSFRLETLQLKAGICTLSAFRMFLQAEMELGYIIEMKF